MKSDLGGRVSSRREAFVRKRVPRRRPSRSVALGMLAVILHYCGALPARSEEPVPTIRVRVLNYTRVTPAAVAAAERRAGQILGDAGLKVIWIDCWIGESSDNPSGPCQQPLSPAEVLLRVVSDRGRNEIPENAFGFAVPPILASVYYEPAARLARIEGYELTSILAGVIAHELGHLLLGSGSHSKFGIMQGQWGSKCLQLVRWNALQFTPEQSKLIRAEGQRRMSLQGIAMKNAVTFTASAK